MAVTLSPIPPIPQPGARDYEAKTGAFLNHMPTLAQEIVNAANAAVDAATLVDVDGNATIAATAAAQASVSAASSTAAATTAQGHANTAKAEATKAARSKADAAVSASQAGISAQAAALAKAAAEAAATEAETIATTTAESVATAAAGAAAQEAVSGVIAQAQASADAAATSAADAETAKNAAQTAATTAGQSVAAIATHAQTAQTASTAASNHAHNAGLRAAESLASAQQATSAGQAATAGAAQVLEILDNLNTGPVVSVNGKYGAVNLVKADLGLGNVDNTSDLDKPISTATQAALGGKSDSGHAHGTATASAAGFMSAADKTKLDGVAANANNYAHPANHPPSIITQDASNRFVTDAEKAAWNGKEASGTAAAAMSAHTSAADPHAQYLPKAGGTMSGSISFAAAQTWPTFNQSSTGNAATATKLSTPRTLTLGSTGKSFDGSGNVSWTLAEMGAQAALVSGTNIKTVNGQSVLGSGDVVVGLNNVAEAISTASPNGTVSAVSLTAVASTTNADLCLVPKGTGALLAQVPTGSSTGGNKRGIYAVDWQSYRTSSNQVASGAASTVSGGNENTAGGSYSTISGGIRNTASGSYSTVSGGNSNTTIGNASTVSGGNVNTASGIYSTISGGDGNTASGSSSTISGGSNATTNGLRGVWAYGFEGNTSGQNQMTFWGGRLQTAGATATRITATAAAATAVNQLALRDNSAFRVRGSVVARDITTNDAKEWTFEALIKRGASAAATAIVGTPSITSTFADAAAASWAIAISADTTNGALAITVTGAASTTIRWTAVVHSIEVA